MADDAQHWNVGVAVTEGEAISEVVALGLCVLADQTRLLWASHDRLEQLTSGDAVLHLEAVADDLGAAEVVGQALEYALERARYQDDVVPGRPALLHQASRAHIE